MINRRTQKLICDRVLKLFRYVLFALCVIPVPASAQRTVSLGKEKQHIFSYSEIQYFKDTSSKLTIGQVSSKTFDSLFHSSPTFTPKTNDYTNTYWYRIRIQKPSSFRGKWILEFYDQTIDHISFYAPSGEGAFVHSEFGAAHPFAERLFNHKNFTVLLNDSLRGEQVYYFAIRSVQPANVMIVAKSVSWFVQYGLKEYFLSGIFYGMILVFCLYNLVMFFVFRQKQYLYYIAYNCSIGFFEMSSNGFAYQYLWPGQPGWNEIAYGVALFVASISSLLFTKEFLLLKFRAPVINRLLTYTLLLRTLFFLGCLFLNRHWFTYKFLEVIPLTLAFYSGIYILKRGYFPARFFVAGYSFLFLGFFIRMFKTLASVNLPFGPANFYSLSFCFLMEMLFVTFAIGDKVSWLRRKKALVQRRMIQEMHLNQELKDHLNRELEQQVQLRTEEVLQKSAQIRQQNEELLGLNERLKIQAAEITRMNDLLAQDNQKLTVHIKKAKEARVMSVELSFEEFCNSYPDEESCLELLAGLKWEEGFRCTKCGNPAYSNGSLSFSRRCTKCGYDESPTMNTLFQNAHIPLNKGFYIVYMVYTTKGKVSSYKLAELLSLRQSTCWNYASRIKNLMEEHKKELRNAGEKGWSRLVVEKNKNQ